MQLELYFTCFIRHRLNGWSHGSYFIGLIVVYLDNLRDYVVYASLLELVEFRTRRSYSYRTTRRASENITRKRRLHKWSLGTNPDLFVVKYLNLVCDPAERSWRSAKRVGRNIWRRVLFNCAINKQNPYRENLVWLRKFEICFISLLRGVLWRSMHSVHVYVQCVGPSHPPSSSV